MKILIHSSIPVFQRVKRLLQGASEREVVFVEDIDQLKRDHQCNFVLIEVKRHNTDTLCRCMSELTPASPILLTDRGTDWNRLAGAGASAFVSIDSGDRVFAARMEATLKRLGRETA